MNLKAHAKALAQDLSSREVNTIRCHAITGENMPDPRHALHDIASEYNDKLNELLGHEERRLEGPDGIMTCRFSAAAYGPDETVELVVRVTDRQGKPLPGLLVDVARYDAPHFEALPDPSPRSPRVQPKDGAKTSLEILTTDADGVARVSFLLTEIDEPCAAIRVKAQSLRARLAIPFKKVKGNLHAFIYLNYRANEARSSHWLVRRIEICSIRLVGILQSVPPAQETAPERWWWPFGKNKSTPPGCDQNNYSRRHLNGAPDKDSQGLPQQKPLPINLQPPDLVALRKIWELSHEEIFMQTVVQLDGDVVTRLSDQAATEEARLIHRIHAEGVQTAAQSWQSLVESLTGFAKLLFRK